MFDKVISLVIGFITGPYVLMFFIFYSLLILIFGNAEERKEIIYYFTDMFSRERIFINLGMLFSIMAIIFFILLNSEIGIIVALLWVILSLILMEVFGNEDNEIF
jgi:hypothetical protein